MAKKSVKKVKYDSKNLLLILLIISLISNLYLLSQLKFQKDANIWKTSLLTARVFARDYCSFKRSISDDEIVSEIKKLPKIGNAKIEEYEGQKTIYISYYSYDSGSWADERTPLNCN